MKNKDTILKELAENGWKPTNEDPFIIEHLVPELTSLIQEKEKVLTGLWGFGLDKENKPTSNKELFVVTDQQIIYVSKNVDQVNEKPTPKARPITDVHKVLIQDSPNKATKRVDVLLIMADDTWSIDALSDDLIKHFEDNINQLFPQAKVDDETFDTTVQAETINIAQDANQEVDEQVETLKKGNWFTNFFTNLSFKSIFKNLEFWNVVSLVMAVAILVTASIATADSSKKSVYIPNGIFTVIFGTIGIFAMVIISMIRWDDSKFSVDLYRSLFGTLIYLLTFIFGIVFAAGANGASSVGAVEIVLAVLLIFDGGYTIVRHHLN